MSKIQEIFCTRRGPVPKYILDLFPNDDCTIENDTLFFEKTKPDEIFFLEANSKEYSAWQYMIFRIYQCLERRIQAQKSLKDNAHASHDDLIANEKGIETIIYILCDLFAKIADHGELVFPYFDQLLECTHSSGVLRSIIQLGLTIAWNNTPGSLIQLSSQFMFAIPYMKLLRHFEWNYEKMVPEISQIISAKKSHNDIPQQLEELLVAVIDSGKEMVKLVKEENFTEFRDSASFASVLSTKLLQEQNLTSEADKLKYYQTIGEAKLASYFFESKFDQRIFADLGAINSFVANFLKEIKEKELLPELQAIQLGLIADKSTQLFKPSLVNVALQKIKEVQDLLTKEVLQEEDKEIIELLDLYFMSIRYNFGQFTPSLDGLKIQNNNGCEFVRKLFSSNPGEDSQEAPIIEIWKTVRTLYKRFYSHFKDEGADPLTKQSDSLKGKVNSLMNTVSLLISDFLCEMTSLPDTFEGEVRYMFKEEYRASVNFLLDDMTQIWENFNWESNYTSVLTLSGIFSTFLQLWDIMPEFENNAPVEDQVFLNIRLKLFKKLEELVKWSFSEEFKQFFDQVEDSNFTLKTVIVILTYLAWVLAHAQLPQPIKKDFLAHLSTFECIDYISQHKDNQILINEFAKKAQEKIIRYYIDFHLYSQTIVCKEDEGEDSIFYNFEKFGQLWKIILFYSVYEKSISEEFKDTYTVIKSLPDESYDNPKYYIVLDADLLAAVYYSFLSNPDLNLPTQPMNFVREILSSLNEHDEHSAQNFLTLLSINLQQYFETFLAEAESMQIAYENGTLSTKNFLMLEAKVYNFMSRLTSLISPLLTYYDFDEAINDSGIKSVMSAYLAKILVSPISYMINHEPTSGVVSMIEHLDLHESFLLSVLPGYATRYLEIISLLDKEITKKEDIPINPILKKKLGSGDINSPAVGNFFVETCIDDPKQTHEINMKLFPVVFMKSIEFRNPENSGEDSTAITDFLTTITNKLPETTKYLVNITHSKMKEQLKKGREVNLQSFKLIDDKNFCEWKAIPATKEYFRVKIVSLIENLRTCDFNVLNEEDAFLLKLSYLLMLKEFVEDLDLDELLEFLGTEGIIEKPLELVFDVLLQFSDMVSNYYNTVLKKNPLVATESKLKQGYQIITNQETLSRVCKIVDDIIANQLEGIDKLLDCDMFIEDIDKEDHMKKSRDSFMKRIWNGLLPFLDKISPSLLLLRVIDISHEIDLSSTIKAMFSCYENVLNSLVDFRKGPVERPPTRVSRFRPKSRYRGRNRVRTMNIVHILRGSRQQREESKSNTAAESVCNENKGESQSKEVVQEEREAKEERLETHKKTFKKFLSKFMIFYNSNFSEPSIAKVYHEVLKEILEEYKSVANSADTGSMMEVESTINVQIYNNPIINKLRVIAPLLLFIIRFKMANQVSSETEHLYYVDVLKSLITLTTELLQKLDIQDLLKEDSNFVENDFINVYCDLIVALKTVAYNMLVSYIRTDTMLAEFNQATDLLLLGLKKQEDIYEAFKGSRRHTLKTSKDSDLFLLLYFSIRRDGPGNTVADYEQMLSLLIKYSRGSFYILAQFFALQAFDPEKIIAIKLKGIAYYNKAKRFHFANKTIKTLEKYWPSELQKAWEKTIEIQKNTAENQRTDPYILTVKEELDMKGKITLDADRRAVTTSVLTYLRDGIDSQARDLITMMLRSLVSDIERYISQIIKGEANDLNLQTFIQDQIACLTMLVRNYPELSVIITTYELENVIEIAPELSQYMPRSNGKESFLSFFIKYAGYFVHLSAYYFLESLVKANKTPIFVEFQGEVILLSTYHELVILQEIYKILEETLKEPNKLFKNIYTSAIWTISSQISSDLLRIIGKDDQRNFKGEIISNLHALCIKALEVHNGNMKQEKEGLEKAVSSKELAQTIINVEEEFETKVVYVFIVRLTEIDVMLKTRKQLALHSRPMVDFYSKKKVQWVSCILKEQFYLGQYMPSIENSVRDATLMVGEDEKKDDKLQYSFKSKGIDMDILRGILRKLLSSKKEDSEYEGGRSLFTFPKYRKMDIKTSLKRYDMDKKDEGVSAAVAECLLNPKTYEGPSTNQFKLKKPSSDSGTKLFLFGNYKSGKKHQEGLPEKFEMFLDKFFTQHSTENAADEKQKEGNVVENNQENEAEEQEEERQPDESKEKEKGQGMEVEAPQSQVNPEGIEAENVPGQNTGEPINLNMENINAIVRENKPRIKLLVQQQHEKCLMSKLEALIKQEVPVNQIRSIQTHIDNVEFYNQQSELDKKLILILANRDFIHGFSEEMQQESKTLRQIFLEAEKKFEEDQRNEEEKTIEEEDEYQSEESREEENINQGNDGVFSGNEERKEASDYGEEEEEKKADAINPVEEEKKEVELEAEAEAISRPEEPRSGVTVMEEEEQNKDNLEPDLVLEKDEQDIIEELQDDTLENIENGAMELEKSGLSGQENSGRRSSSPTPSSSSSSSSSATEKSESCSSSTSGDDDEYHEAYLENDRGGYAYFSEICPDEINGDEEEEENLEVANFREIMEAYKSIKKRLEVTQFIPRSVETMVEEKLDINLSLENWVAQVFFMLQQQRKLQTLDTQNLPYSMNKYSLLCKHLVLTLLDPYKEGLLMSLLALYLLDYDIKFFEKVADKEKMKENILCFLHQYAIRSPSIFFRSFSLQNLSSYLIGDQGNNKLLEKLSILDLLLKYFIQKAKSQQENKTSYIQNLIYFLLQVRLTVQEDIIPEFIQDLRQKNVLPLTEDLENQFFKALDSKSLGENHTLSLYKWLECLAHMPHYRNGAMHTCDRLLSLRIPEEKEVLGKFIQEARESIKAESDPTLTQKNHYQDTLLQLSLHTPEILKVLNNILKEALENDAETRNAVQETETFKNLLKDISLCYMEALELVSKLEEKNYLKTNDLKPKLYQMLDVPVQYYIQLIKLKELAMANNKPILTDLNAPPPLEYIPSEQDAPKSLQRSYAAIRNEDTSFQEVFPLWMSNCREFVKKVLEDSEIDKNSLRQVIVKKFPWVMDFSIKEKSLREAIGKLERETSHQETVLTIRRDNILEDTIKEFERNSAKDLLAFIKVDFAGELGVDQGGLKKEWINLFTKEIFDPMKGLFKLSPNMRTIHPNPLSLVQPGELNYFKAAGTLVGLAIKEKTPIDINFSKSFLKLILGVQPKLNDLEDIEPELMNSLRWMVNNDVTELDQPFIYELDAFGVKVSQDLVENGSTVILDEFNKDTFISKMCMAKTLKEVEKQIQYFKKGFFRIVPEDTVKIFSSGELGILISGRSEIDIQDMIEHLNTNRLGKSNPLVEWFKEILQSMDQNMLSNLLFFITGTSKVPHRGFRDAPIMLIKGSSETSSLPIAHTCFSELELPPYESKEKFYEKLLLAISEGKEGFHIA